jgi:hypothetical protein
MYFFQNTGLLYHIKDSRAYTLFRKLQFLGNFRGFSDKKLLGNFSLKSGVFRGFFSSMGWQPCKGIGHIVPRLPEAVEVLKGAAKMNKKSLPGDEEVQVKLRKS